jgi:hypothetical protein
MNLINIRIFSANPRAKLYPNRSNGVGSCTCHWRKPHDGRRQPDWDASQVPPAALSFYRLSTVPDTDLSKTQYFKLPSIPAHVAAKYCNKQNKKPYRFKKKSNVAAFLWCKNKNGRKLWNNSIVFLFALYNFLLFFSALTLVFLLLFYLTSFPVSLPRANFLSEQTWAGNLNCDVTFHTRAVKFIGR